MIIGILEQGFIYAIMALGVMITYKILDFPDLTVDGSFPLGAAVTVCLITRGFNPYIALFISLLAGALAGIVTGFIHVKCRVRDLLSGIITMTGLYTVNLLIAGKANVPIFNRETIFDNSISDGLFVGGMSPFKTVIIICIILLAVGLLLSGYMKTKSGFLLRAVGDNDKLVTALAKDKGMVKIVGLSIANGLAALAGSVICQQQRFFEVSMGTGTIVIGLASVIMGTSLLKHFERIPVALKVVIGAVLYKACVALALKANMDTVFLKLITALLFLIILILSERRKGAAVD